MINLIVKWFFGMVGGKMDGYKTRIGGVALILAGMIQVIKLFFPDLEIVGIEQVDLDTTLGYIGEGLAAFGVGVGGTGVAHKVYKEGLQTPCPPELCPPTTWDGKTPGQFP